MFLTGSFNKKMKFINPRWIWESVTVQEYMQFISIFWTNLGTRIWSHHIFWCKRELGTQTQVLPRLKNWGLVKFSFIDVSSQGPKVIWTVVDTVNLLKPICFLLGIMCLGDKQEFQVGFRQFSQSLCRTTNGAVEKRTENGDGSVHCIRHRCRKDHQTNHTYPSNTSSFFSCSFKILSSIVFSITNLTIL